MELKFIGGCTIGKPNLIVISHNKEGIVLDCGFQYEMPPFDKIDVEVKHIFISHAHADHIGGITILKRKFPEAKIYMSEPTKEIGKITLGSLEIKSKYRIPQKEIEEVLNDVTILGEGDIIKINENIKVQPISAGHLLGAFSYLFKIDSHNLFYTGDISLGNLPLAGNISLGYQEIDLAISESNFTLGEESFIESASKIANLVTNVIKIKGKIVMPMPAAGRAQEIATFLAYKMILNDMPYVPIYVDGSIKDVMNIYDRYVGKLRGYLKDYYINARRSGIIKSVNDDMRKSLLTSDKPCIIMTTSANLKHGPSLIYVQNTIMDDRSMILFTGKVEDKTLAKKILNSKRGELIDFNGIALGRKCNIQLVEINEHGTVGEYIKLVQRSPIRGLILIHGNDIIKNYLTQFLIKEKKNLYLNDPKEFDVIDFDLLVRSYSKQTESMDVEIIEYIIEKLVEDLRREYDRTRSLSDLIFSKAMEEQEIYSYIKNKENAKEVFFIFFRYATKFSFIKEEGVIDFRFASIILDKVSREIERIMGKGTVKELFNQLNETAPKFFKNIILRGGTMKAQLGITIPSKQHLIKTLESFQNNFSAFEVKSPTLEEIEKLCRIEVAQDPSLKLNYEKIFSK
jgi:Predicted exonuclease of the beta-lactamase fold involved in RNA processing